MRVLLDTNVLVSAFLLRDAIPRRLVDHCLGSLDLVTSPKLIEELESVLSRPKIAARTSPLLAQGFIEAYSQTALLADEGPALSVCRDPADDHVLATAVAVEAALVVTGDNDLLVLDPFGDVRILTPVDALVWLSAHGEIQ